jgi:hypothetical protein
MRTATFFQTLGVDPLYGRHFTAEEEAVGGPPGIVGRRIRLDGIDRTVVGVLPATGRLWMPAGAFLVTDAQLWKPATAGNPLSALKTE